MVSDITKQTLATVAHHLEAVMSGDIDAVLSDYSEESICFTPEGPVRGLQQIRSGFEAMVSNMPPGMTDAMEMIQQDAEGEVAYLFWKAEPFVSLGTDTFIVRNGKIVVQTYAMSMPSNS